MFGSLKALFYGGSKGFRPYEKQCLDWFSDHLSEEAKNRLQAQIGLIELIQRALRDQEVDIHYIPKKVSENIEFLNGGLELHAGRVVFRVLNHSQIICEILFNDGFFDRILYDTSPKLWHNDTITLDRVETFADLMQSDTRERKPVTGPLALPAKLQDGNFKDLAMPAPEREIDILVRRLAPALPSDYVELLRITDGFDFEHWTVNGLRTWTRVDDDYGFITWLAEGEALDTSPRSLVILHKDTEPKVYLRDEENHEFTEMGSSFIDALHEAALGEYENDPDEASPDDTSS